MPSGCGRKCRLLSVLIGIAIGSRDEPTPAMVNVGDHATGRGDVEASTGTHRYLTQVGPPLRAAHHDGAHEVTRLKASDPFVLFGAGAWQPEAVHAAHLSAAKNGCHDLKRHDLRHVQLLGRACAHTRRIQPV